MIQDQSAKEIAVIGYGVTGKACIQFLLDMEKDVTLFVSDLYSIQLKVSEDKLLKRVNLSEFNETSEFDDFDFVVVSPGIDSKHPALEKAQTQGVELVSEIELFALHNQKPVVAITGSNGKSTVVDMLHTAFEACGIKTGLGGNFGTSALSLLNHDYELMVLEVSSFQLELTKSLKPKIAAVLNVTEDHMDRHGSIENYAKVKRNIYNNAELKIVNRDDDLTYDSSLKNTVSFGFGEVHNDDDAWIDDEGIWVAGKLAVSAMHLTGVSKHNLLNLQVALLAGFHLLDKPKHHRFVQALLEYRGLPHRFEPVMQIVNKDNQPVLFIDDSKATNVGAVIAALANVPPEAYLFLIVGGDSKKIDMSPLEPVIRKRVNRLMCIGKDADLFMQMNENSTKFETLDEVLDTVFQQMQYIAQPVYVLLSPACASTDMFENYQHRGECFKQAVRQRSK